MLGLVHSSNVRQWRDACDRDRSKGGPDVLELGDEPEPSAGEDELLVAVEAVGVNYRDVYEREGRGAAYGQAKLPLIVGAEGAGTVLRGAGGFAEGDRVAWAAAPASYAERTVVSIAQAVAVPDGVASDIAAAALLQGMTAHYLCHSTYPVQPGDVAVVHAAAGGVGLLLTQMIKARGGAVIATTSTEEKAALARAAGADHTIGYDGFTDKVLELTGGEGAAVVYDAIGETTFEDGIDALRKRGFMVLYGMASGPAPAYDPQRLQAGSLYITPPGSARLHGHARGAARAGGRRARLDRGWLLTCGSALATRSRTRSARTRISRPDARPESCC